MTTIIESSPDIHYNTRYLFYPLLLLVSGLWLLYRWQQNSRLFTLGNKLPGPIAFPLFGNALLVLGKKPEQILGLALEYAKRYGSVVRGWLGTKLIVFLSDAEDIEVILNSQIHINKASEYRFFKPWLGEGLLISSETAMGITRKTQDASGFDYAMAVMKMCDILHQRHYKFWLRFDAIFQFTPLFKKQIRLLQIIHGLTNKVIKSKKETYYENKAKGFIPPTLEELTATVEDDPNDTKTLSDTVFKGYRDDLDFNDDNDVGVKKRLAFLDLMIESAQNGTNNITDNEIKEEVDTIMFEGHDTTAAGSSFVLCILGVHQNIQARVYDEIYEIFGDSDRPVTFADTLLMKYLERVILETLRMYPPVPVIARELTRDVKIATDGYVLPATSTVVIATYTLHRNPKYYKDPDVFNPDNFLPENAAARHYYSFIPFSAGPRSCVGRKYALLKLKVLISTVLRNFKSISDVTEDQFKLQVDIILKRSDGFRIRLEPRVRAPSTC